MAAMTYLQLCQFAHRYLRSGNQQPGIFPTTIPPPANSDQVIYDIVDTVPRAWEWVQNEHPSWNFMRKQQTFTLTNGQRVYTRSQIIVQIPDYDHYIPFWGASNFPYFLIFDGGASPSFDFAYPFVEYQDWRGFWDRLPRPSGNLPNRLTERPDLSLEFDPTPGLTPSGPANKWTVRLDYRVQNQTLANAGDFPFLPSTFHEMIGWVTIRMICESRMNAGPLYQSAVQEIDKYMQRLKARYLPIIQVDTTYA